MATDYRSPNYSHGATVGCRSWGDFPGAYRSWLAMKARCANPKSVGWNHYGGRGITVCDRWIDSYSAFYADMGDRPPKFTLDRIDPNKGYSPENCRWASYYEQTTNKRNTPVVELNGVVIKARDACERLGLNWGSFRTIRCRHGWTAQETLEYFLESPLIQKRAHKKTQK